MAKIVSFIRGHIVFCIATMAAIISSAFVHPDAEYLNYIDYKTIACLFSTLAVVCALRNIMFFTVLSRKIVSVIKNLRMLAISLVIITFVGSMLIANDMALITFLPLGYLSLSVTGKEKHCAYIFILQNISANLGGMLTPFGNPQNLYLYSSFNISTLEFIQIMLFPFLLAVTMLIICCLPLKCEPLSVKEEIEKPLDRPKSVIYIIMFIASILAVFRILPYIWVAVAIFVVLFVMDRGALKAVDYPLLLTFVMFFIFAGNVSRLDIVQKIASLLLSKSVLLVSVLSCQLISNVPSAILLSKFTDNYKELLLGVNIGGTGTIIASLASLITYSEFKVLYPNEGKKYMKIFIVLNLLFLVILTVFAFLVLV